MDLNDSIDFDLKRFFVWWGRELVFFVPPKIRDFLSDKSGHIFLIVTGDTLKIVHSNNEHNKTIIEMPFDDEGLIRCQRWLEEKHERKKSHLVLRLTSEQAIKRRVSIPSAAKENINQVIAYELNRYTPFDVDKVYFSFKQEGKIENDQLKILMILTPREVLDAIYLKLNGAEIYPDIVDYQEAPNNFDDVFDIYNLLPEWERPVKNRIIQGVGWLLSFSALLLMIAVLVFPVWQEAEAVSSLRQQLKVLKKDTQFVQSRLLELDEIVAETEQLSQLKMESLAIVELIDELSTIIADNTWLKHLNLKDNRLLIQGQSATAEALIGVLENSSTFTNVRFVSPLTQDKRSGLERFEISAKVDEQGVSDATE